MDSNTLKQAKHDIGSVSKSLQELELALRRVGHEPVLREELASHASRLDHVLKLLSTVPAMESRIRFMRKYLRALVTLHSCLDTKSLEKIALKLSACWRVERRTLMALNRLETGAPPFWSMVSEEFEEENFEAIYDESVNPPDCGKMQRVQILVHPFNSVVSIMLTLDSEAGAHESISE